MQKKVSCLFHILCVGAALGSGSFLLSGCTPVVSQHGNLVEDYRIEDVKVGESSRSDVLRVLGSPTTQSTFNPDIWYYIGQETEKYGILDQEVTEERIIVVTFDEQGLVREIRPVSGERQDIPYARSKTPTHGNSMTVMQQLLGNLGRFNTSETSATDY
ncbi:MAG: outer membrane protein assembly factor BamE [Alphaproteobacteria bacterium]